MKHFAETGELRENKQHLPNIVGNITEIVTFMIQYDRLITTVKLTQQNGHQTSTNHDYVWRLVH
jgi:hypothetical protein